ncbi:MAG: SIS domain-containing protein [Planctomycetia bacterium]|nr:SIS domain-containing protein [Planctomycetia bacterium]
MDQWLKDYIEAQHRALDSIPVGQIRDLVDVLEAARTAGRRIFVIGNGGSAANASHFTTDLGKNASEAHGGTRPPFRVTSLTDNLPWITAIGNDYAFDEIFVKQLRNLASHGDVLIAASVSGSSPNLVRAFEWAREHGLETIALVGGKRGKIADLATHVIVVADNHYGRVEDTQMNIFHMLCYAFVENA